jgi:hypothetical protein
MQLAMQMMRLDDLEKAIVIDTLRQSYMQDVQEPAG